MAKQIKLYALSTCIHCKQTKEYLEGCGKAYECVFVDKLEGEERRKAVEAVRKLNPSLSFPTLVIGDDVVVGFKKERIEELLGGKE